MSIKIRLSGSSVWTSVGNGALKYRAPDGSWLPARFFRVRVGDSWFDAGYGDFPLPPINFRVTDRGNGKDGIVAFAWDPPTDGAAPTSYKVNVYFQNDDNPDSELSFTTTSRTASVTFPTHPRTDYWVDVASINSSGQSILNSNRIQVTLGPNPHIEYGGGWGPVEWHAIDPISASSYWNVNNYPVANISDGNSASQWLSAGHSLPNDSAAYEGVIGGFTTTTVNGLYRKLSGIRYRGNASGEVWVGFRVNSTWQGTNSLNRVTGATATYVQHAYIHTVSGAPLADDGWRYVNLTGIYETEQVGAPGTLLSVTWGPSLPYSADGAAWSSNTKYRVDVSELVVGSRAWDPYLNPFTVPAGSNIITYL